MIELLKLCGFEENELESELPRIEKAFNKIGLTAEDIEQGKKRLNKYFDIELQGVRKLIKLHVQELVNSILAREDGKTKLIYGNMAPGYDILGSALVSKSNEVYAPSIILYFQLVVGYIFGKLDPILEAAEEQWLKSGAVAHCGNQKSVLGIFALDLIPRPDLFVTSGSLCETAPKTLDLIHEMFDIPVHSYDICQDREYLEYPEAAKRIIELSSKGLRRLVKDAQKVVGFEISDDLLEEVLEKKGELSRAAGKIWDLIKVSDPLPISLTNENLWYFLLDMPLSVNRMPEAIDAVNTLYDEIKERVNNGLGVLEKGAPRILSSGTNNFVDPRLEYLIGEMGMALVGTDVYFRVPDVENPRDPYETWSMYLQSSLYTSLARRIPLIVEGCKKLNLDGVLIRNHPGCRGVCVDVIMVGEALMKELEIPVVLLDTEVFDPRAYDHEQFKRKLETFKTML